MRALLDVLMVVLDLAVWVVIIQAIVSWLVHFGVINASNQVVATIWQITRALTEPLLRPIRRHVPPIGGMDLSPIILILAIFLLQRVIVYYVYPNVF
ncbi:MAG: YggT family protein [Pseudomonadota bacterium]